MELVVEYNGTIIPAIIETDYDNDTIVLVLDQDQIEKEVIQASKDREDELWIERSGVGSYTV